MAFDSEVLKTLGVTREQALEDYQARHRPEPSKAICVCGHPYNHHTQARAPRASKRHDQARAENTQVCASGRRVCPCGQFRLALHTADTRVFTFSTKGAGPEHALSKGIKAAEHNRLWVDWHTSVQCYRCHRFNPRDDDELAPVALDEWFRECDRPSDGNYMLCIECRSAIVDEFVAAGSRRPDVVNAELQGISV